MAENIQNQESVSEEEIQDAFAAFEDAFATESVATPEEATPPVEKVDQPPQEAKEPTNEGEGEESPAEPEEPEFDNSLLDLELKRLDERMTLKEFLTKYPEEAKEALQKKWDYDARKAEFKEYAKKEKEYIERQKENIDSIILRNIAYEVNMPLKTLEDFENDVRFEDSEAAYNEYLQEFKAKAQPLLNSKKIAEEETKEMIEDFSREFKDIDVKEIFHDIKPYLSASTAMGYKPFPKDALKVFYRGKNFDKLVEQEIARAKEQERKKIYTELKIKPTDTNLNKITGAREKKAGSDLSGLPPEVQEFERAWNF